MKTTLEQELSDLESRAQELREKIAEEKERNKPKDVTASINDYGDILKTLKLDTSADDIKIIGFDDEENEFIKAVIQKTRIAKVYRGEHVFKVGEQRWYGWYDLSSGFALNDAGYDSTGAITCSASRLCFLNRKHAEDYDKKFKHIEEKIIDIKR